MVFGTLVELGGRIILFLLIRAPVEAVKVYIPGQTGWFGDGRITGISILRHLFETMGTTFIKLGQILSMRAEAPLPLKQDLQKIQDNVPAVGFSDVEDMLRKELGAPVEDVFEWIDPEPLAAASLAQVHRARLRKEQEDVAVKIQRPHLQGIVKIDTMIIDIALGIVRLALPLFRRKTDLSVFTVSFSKHLDQEIDFISEGRYQDKMRLIIEDHTYYSRYVKIARVHWDYTTSKLLTMELVKDFHRLNSEKGNQILLRHKLPEFRPERACHLGLVEAFRCSESCFKWGFVHGDAHYGNLYVMEDGRIFLCDFGMMDVYSPELRDAAIELFLGLMYYADPDITLEALSRLHEQAGGKPNKVNWSEARDLVQRLILRRVIKPTPDSMPQIPVDMKGAPNLLDEAVYLLIPLGFKFPDGLWLYVKALAYINQMGFELFPRYDCATMFVPIIAEQQKQRLLAEMKDLNVTEMREFMNRLNDFVTGPGLRALNEMQSKMQTVS